MKTRFLALLRGINVGGNNIIKMTDLKTCFEEMGFTNVVTYIQSGNVLFDSQGNKQIQLTEQIEKTLSACFNYTSKVVLVSQQNLIQLVNNAPEGFGVHPDEYRYDVIFLKPPLTSEEKPCRKLKQSKEWIL